MEVQDLSDAARVPTGLAALIQRRAVLEPLAGPVEGDEQVVTATRHVGSLWRDRVLELARAGLPELANPTPSGGRAIGRRALTKAAERRDRAVNCPPPFIVSAPRGRACGLHAVCPHCGARLVERLWRGIDKALCQPEENRRWEWDKIDRRRPKDPYWVATMAQTGVTPLPPPVRPPGPSRLPRATAYDLIEWVTTLDAPKRLVDPATGRAFETVGGVVQSMTDERVRSVLYRRSGVHGALDAPTIVPRGDGWHAEVRRLLMVPAGAGPPPAWEPLLAGGDVRVIATPTREEVLEAVAQACRYPPELLTGADPERVVALFEARRGRLVRVAYSRFGGKGTCVPG